MTRSSAIFSDDRKYRYALSREWQDKGKTLVFCMLNPSTADESKNDPTIERCQRRAKALGFSALVVVNIFALRSTDPKALYDAEDPEGPNNLPIMIDLCRNADMVICGWGKHGELNNQGNYVLGRLLSNGIKPHVLKLNKDGSPAHPLYIGYDVKPIPIDIASR